MRTRYLGIVNFATRRRVTIAMIALGVVVFGLVAQTRLPVTLLPDIEHPTLTVQTELEGAAPEEVEYLVTRPLEEALATTTGVRRVDSASRAGQSEVSLEFEWGTAMDTAVVDIRERLDWAELPQEADPPQVLRFDPQNDPIMRLSLSDEAEENLGGLRRYAEDELARELEVLPGVAAARVSGGLDQEIQVRVDDERMAALDLDIAGIRERIDAENVNVAGGQLREDSREILVRTLNRFEDPGEIGALVIERIGNSSLRLDDIAEVGMGHADPNAILRLDGEEAVEIAVYREGDANTVQTARAVQTELDALEARLPDNMELAKIQDQSRFIERAVNEVVTAGVIGGLLAALMLYLFLGRVRPTLVIAVAIPLSVLGTFLLMHGGGIGLNVMSLGGIALAVGLLVDSAIVVLENISRRREAGDAPLEAARRGAGEVGSAITASTLTTIAVFLPLVFVEGLAGQLFGDQALAITFALLIALLIALTIIPMLSVPAARPPEEGQPPSRSAGWRGLPGRVAGATIVGLLILLRAPARGLARLGHVLTTPLRTGFDAVWGRLQRGYPRLLDWSLDHPGRIWIVALAVVGLALATLPRLGTELMPEVSQGEFDMVVELPPGTDLERTDATLEALRASLDEALPIAATASMAGSGDRLDATPGEEGENLGRLTVRMDPDAGAAEEARIAERLRAELSGREDLRYRIERPQVLRFEQPLELTLRGERLDSLGEGAELAREAMLANGGFSDVRSSMAEGYPEVRIELDRDLLAALDLDAATTAERVADHVRGQAASRYSMPDRELDIHVRGREETRRSLEALRALPVNPGATHPLPLEAVADLEIAYGPAEIRRQAQQRVATVAADPADGDTGRAAEELTSIKGGLELPAGVQAEIGGQGSEMDEAFAAMLMALVLSIFLVYLVMASQFESLLHPFLILFTVPLALSGAILGLWLTDSSLSVVVFIGLMMLGGIIVNNAIVLVDRINRQRREGRALREAVMEAGRTRLRPILMTAATTILALLPLAMGFGEGSELRAPMGVTVIGGLLAGTLLTLVLIPASYYWLEKRRGVTS